MVSVKDRASTQQESDDPQSRYQELVDSLDGIVWECDAKTMRFLFVSRQAERLLGYPVERWCNEPNFWQDIMHPDDRLWTAQFCAEQTARLQPHQFEYRLIAADGRIMWLRDLVNVVAQNGEPVRLRGVMVDVTEQRRIQSERDRLLSEEQAHRASAEAAVHARDDFLSIASHELRTPITSLYLAVQSLLRLAGKGQLEQLGAQQLVRALQAAERQSKRLRRLIDTMLDISRIQAGRLELDLEEVDLAAIAHEVARNFSEDLAAAQSTLCLQADSPVIGFWDPGRLEQVISNLISNAVKYGAGKAILLRVEEQGDTARLVIIDHGIGIAKDRQAQIFERFERAVSSRNYGGLGLGLYITRWLVQSHGGTIEVESIEGEGATFTVALPKGVMPGGTSDGTAVQAP